MDLEGGRLASWEAMAVPGLRDLPRVPEEGFASLEQVLEMLGALPDEEHGVDDLGPRPLLEVAVRLDRPQAGLRQEIEDALAGKRARLARITPQYTGSGLALPDEATARDLGQMTEEEVFRHRYRSLYDGEPEDRLLAAFHEALDAVRQGSQP